MSAPASPSPWLRKHPLLFLSLAAVAGILITDRQAWEPGWGWGVLIALAWFAVWRRRSIWMAAPAVALTFGLLHSVRLAETYAHPLRQQLLSSSDQGMDVTLRGSLHPWLQGSELDAKSALCEVTAIRRGREGDFQPTQAKIKVRLQEGRPLAAPGFYEINGSLSPPRPPMNPGQFDAADYALRMGWIAQLRVQEIHLLRPDPWAFRFKLLQAAEASRQWITRQLTQGLENEGDHAAVILAMALGASDAAGQEIEDSFRDSGTLHVFAVSGLHVVMLAYIASFGLRWLGVQRMAFFLILLVFGYAFLTGWRPSAARAAFMMGIVLVGPLLNRRALLPNTLGAAALILLFFDTHQLFMAGFQLSFGVLLAILIIAGDLMDQARPWCELDPFLPPSLASWFQRTVVWLRLKGASLIAVSIAAWIGSFPFMVYHFSTVTPVALISNLFLVPASGVCLGLACASLLFSACHWSSAVLWINFINACLTKCMAFTAALFAELPGATHTFDLRFFKDTPPAEMRVLHLPFGGGAGYLRSGDQRWLLDTGNEDNWRYVLRPFLRENGINSLHGIVLTHADISHVGAAPFVVKTQHVRHLHTSLLEPWRSDPPSASLRALSQTIQPDGPLWKRHSLNEVIPLGFHNGRAFTAQVLHPGPADLYEKANDRALVLLIQAGEFRVLWLSDAGFITEKRLLERNAPIRCDILVRHQHNADFSGLTELLLAAQPQAVISSNDGYRIEEMLPQRIRDHCQRYQIPLFDLEACGSVGIEFRDRQAVLKGYLSDQSITIQPRLDAR